VVSISVTALLPIVLFLLTGALSLGEATAAFVHRYIFGGVSNVMVIL
jgi:sodium-dependent dicarboxylate transporter 2/3/5